MAHPRTLLRTTNFASQFYINSPPNIPSHYPHGLRYPRIIQARVKRNNVVLTKHCTGLKKGKTNASSEAQTTRASYFTNLMRVSKTMKSFQLSRGYAPSVLGTTQYGGGITT